ncbi:MAG: N-acetyltransferase [Acidobacteria bacterium]|nr:MAG: N-acetyltransferase [Acidobacteriota bacterium]
MAGQLTSVPALFMEIHVRELNDRDLGDVIALIRDFADFEGLGDFFNVTDDRLHNAMFGPNSFVEGLGAFEGASMAGYALFFPCFASFRGQSGYFLEDLFVKQEFRKSGVGKLLLSEIVKRAKARGFERIDFQVLEWNLNAIRFYETLGAVKDADERHFKFTDEAFRGLYG